MKGFRLLFNCAVFLLLSTVLTAQKVSVIEMFGKIQISTADGKSFQNLVYGDYPMDRKVNLEQNARLTLSKSNGEICQLNQKGTYALASLKFGKPQSTSAAGIFDNLCAFFKAHPSSESKEQYKNSIYAISRGEVTTPFAVFPFEGKVPMIDNSVLFRWDIDCDTCAYELVIKDLFTRKELLRQDCEGLQYKLENADKVLKVDGKYYWFVKVKHQPTSSNQILFDMVSNAEYESTIGTLEKEISSSKQELGKDSKLAFILNGLDSEDLGNFAYIFGQKQVDSNKGNENIEEIYNRYVYDKLNNTEK